MSDTSRQPIYAHQRDVINAIADSLRANPEGLDPVFANDYEHATTAQAQQRVIVDQVASLTDQSAMAFFERLSR